jgi:hypothetical protein
MAATYRVSRCSPDHAAVAERDDERRAGNIRAIASVDIVHV